MPRATLHLDPAQTGHRVSRYVFGQFIEPLGSCIDGGVWVGEDSAIPNEEGIRIDTLEALKKLDVPVVRWPGGLWADSYHWQDGIGPRENRPIRQNLGWNRFEDSQFGTHEFMRFCRLIGAEPYLCCNLGTGTVEEARSWAEYCNCAHDTTLTRQRNENGDPEPFDVKFWGLGNEVGYVLDGAMTPQYYADRARHFAGYVKHYAAQCMFGSEEPFKHIKTVLALNDAWLEPFVEALGSPGAWSYFDLLSVHLFTGHFDEDPVQQFYKHVGTLAEFDAKLDRYTEWADKLSTEEHSVDIAVDEWATWRAESSHYNGLQQPCQLAEGLWAAGIFHLFFKYPRVFMANVAQTVNVLVAPIRVDGDKFWLTPVYHVYEMLRPHGEGRTVEVRLDGVPGLELPEGVSRGAMSVAATVSDDGKDLFVSVVNFDTANDINCAIEVGIESSWRVTEIRRMTSGAIDDGNTFEDPNRVQPETVDIGEGEISFPAQSLTAMHLAL